MPKKKEKIKVKKVKNINYLEKRGKFCLKKFYSVKNTRLNFFFYQNAVVYISTSRNY